MKTKFILPTWSSRLWSLLALFPVFLTGRIVAQDEFAQPRHFFKAMAEKVESEIKFDDLHPDFPDLVERADVFFGGEKDMPSRYVNLDEWSERKVVESGFPVVFNPQTRRLELARETLESASPAVREFAYFFCKAYDRLTPALGQSGSPLAVGTAALAAADRLYPTAHANLPLPVLEHTAMVRVLLLERPQLWSDLFGGGENLEKNIQQTIVAITRVKTADEGTGRLVVGPVHDDLSWFVSKPAAEASFSLDDLLSIHPDAARDLAARATKIRNLTLRARILHALLIVQVGSPSITAEAVKTWRPQFTSWLADLVTELKQRRTGATGDLAARPVSAAPTFSVDKPENVTVGDPASVTAAFPMAVELALGTDQPGWQREKIEALDAESLLALLRSTPFTKDLLDLAGSSPRLYLQREGKAGGDTNVLCMLAFESLVRPYPSEFKGDADKLSRLGFERVWLVWWKPEPLGEGKPFVGIHPDTLLTVLDDKATRRVRAVSVKLGDKIIGYSPVLDPSRTNAFSLAQLKPVPFTVVKVTLHRVRQHQELVLYPEGGGVRGSLRLTPRTHVVSYLGETERTSSGVWRFANMVEPASKTWVGKVAATVGVVVPREFPPGKAVEFVEITLAGKNRKEANNLAVSLSSDGQELALVEASPVNASCIHPEERMELASGTSGQTVEASKVVPDADYQNGVQGTALAGYYVRPEDDPWPNPVLSKHIVWAVTTNYIPQQLAYKLVFEDNTTIILGELSWVLTLSGTTLNETCVSPLTLTPGMKVVTGLNGDNPTTVSLKKPIEPIYFAPPNRPVFITFENANAGLAKAGPILVVCEERPLDEYVPGVLFGSSLALLESSGTESSIATANVSVARSAPFTRRPLAQKSLLVDPASLRGKTVASFDEAVSISNFVETALGPTPFGPTSRTYGIEALNPQSKALLRVWTGPAQYLAAHRPKERATLWVKTSELVPGDLVLLANPGDTAPAFVRVQRVIRRFHLPNILAVSMTRRLAASLYEDRLLPHGKIAFNEGLGIALSDPGLNDNSAPAERLEAHSDGRGGSGLTISSDRKGDARNSSLQGIFVPKLPKENLDDMIQIPAEAFAQLRQRGAELVASFANEKSLLKPLPQQHKAFWDRQLKIPLTSLVKDVIRENSSTTDAATYLSNRLDLAQSARLPYEEDGVDGMARWMGLLLRSRQGFLDSPSSMRFAEVAFLETVMASWLHQMGGVRTAQMLQREVVELSLLAACDRDKASERIRNLQLLLLIELPTFVTGETPDALNQFPIVGSVQKVVEGWGTKSTNEVVRDGRIRLSSVKAALAKEINLATSPYIVGIPRVGVSGELTPAPGVKPADAKDHEHSGRLFTEWLVTRAKHAAFDPPISTSATSGSRTK